MLTFKSERANVKSIVVSDSIWELYSTLYSAVLNCLFALIYFMKFLIYGVVADLHDHEWSCSVDPDPELSLLVSCLS